MYCLHSHRPKRAIMLKHKLVCPAFYNYSMKKGVSPLFNIKQQPLLTYYTESCSWHTKKINLSSTTKRKWWSHNLKIYHPSQKQLLVMYRIEVYTTVSSSLHSYSIHKQSTSEWPINTVIISPPTPSPTNKTDSHHLHVGSSAPFNWLSVYSNLCIHFPSVNFHMHSQ